MAPDGHAPFNREANSTQEGGLPSPLTLLPLNLAVESPSQAYDIGPEDVNRPGKGAEVAGSTPGMARIVLRRGWGVQRIYCASKSVFDTQDISNCNWNDVLPLDDGHSSI
jgi:hypothetical protein